MSNCHKHMVAVLKETDELMHMKLKDWPVWNNEE